MKCSINSGLIMLSLICVMQASLAGVSQAKYQKGLPEQCSELSIDLINLSNHQSKPICQGKLATAGIMVDLAGQHIDSQDNENAKSYFIKSHQIFDEVGKFECDNPKEISLMKQREEAIHQQIL